MTDIMFQREAKLARETCIHQGERIMDEQNIITVTQLMDESLLE